MGDLLGAVGQAISGAFKDVVDAIQGAFQGAFGAASGSLGLPFLFVGGFIVLGIAAWALAKR